MRNAFKVNSIQIDGHFQGRFSQPFPVTLSPRMAVMAQAHPGTLQKIMVTGTPSVRIQEVGSEFDSGNASDLTVMVRPD